MNRYSADWLGFLHPIDVAYPDTWNFAYPVMAEIENQMRELGKWVGEPEETYKAKSEAYHKRRGKLQNAAKVGYLKQKHYCYKPQFLSNRRTPSKTIEVSPVADA